MLERAKQRSRTRHERGAVLMEAAFVFPVLMMLVFGMVSLGLALSQRNAVDNAAREASRFGATHPVTGSIADWLDDVSDVAVAASTGELDAGAPGRYLCVALANSTSDGRKVEVGTSSPSYSASGDCPGTSCPTSAPCVQVVLARTAKVDAVAFKRSIAIDSSNVSTFERHS